MRVGSLSLYYRSLFSLSGFLPLRSWSRSSSLACGPRPAVRCPQTPMWVADCLRLAFAAQCVRAATAAPDDPQRRHADRVGANIAVGAATLARSLVEFVFCEGGSDCGQRALPFRISRAPAVDADVRRPAFDAGQVAY